jgi:pimeloyl-ACP methyl ester carboxylesterase
MHIMTSVMTSKGYFQDGMPYNKIDGGPGTLIIFQGLVFENKPMPGFMIKQFSRMYGCLEKTHTIYVVNRKPGTSEGTTMTDIANDYADMVRTEFGGPVDVLGISTGGSIVQHFAADHPDLVRKLVIHSAAHTLSDKAKRGQMLVAKLTRQKQWRKAYAAIMGVSLPEGGIKRMLLKPLYGFISLFGGVIFGKPKEHPADVAIIVEAEDRHAFKDRLHEIKAPTLVIAGDKDPFYTPELFRETAQGIPGCKFVLYKNMGHPASGKKFKAELIAFLQ